MKQAQAYWTEDDVESIRSDNDSTNESNSTGVLGSDTDSDRRGSEEYESDSSVISETSDHFESIRGSIPTESDDVHDGHDREEARDTANAESA